MNHTEHSIEADESSSESVNETVSEQGAPASTGLSADDRSADGGADEQSSHDPSSHDPSSHNTASSTAEPEAQPDATKRTGRVRRLEEEGEVAADYLEELLDIVDLDGDIDMDVEGDRAAVSVVGEGLDRLVGDEGTVLERLQDLTRLAVYRETGERSRLMLDVGGHRADVRKNVELLAREVIEDVRESGEPVKLSPMSPFERKIVHDAVAEAGLRSESEGEEPTRCVVVLPA